MISTGGSPGSPVRSSLTASPRAGGDRLSAHGPNGRALAYLLTPAGREAEQVVASLREWGKRRKLRHEVSPGASVATTAVTFMTLTPKSQLRIRHPQLAE